MKRGLVVLMLAVPLSLSMACGGNNDNNENSTVTDPDENSETNNANNVDPDPDPDPEPGNIVEVAGAAGFETLLSAATDAGLADTLADGGPFTVFAPTDEAFAAVGDAIPSDAGLLANILLHHVVAGEQDSEAVVGAGSLTTLANTTLAVDASGDPITVNGFALSGTLDVEASNGVIHVLDEVIIPPTILETAAATDDLSTLVTAVGESSQDVQDVLGSAGPITVFAPVNSAFDAIPTDDLNALLADQEALDDVLSYHVATGQTLSADLSDGQVITMANGETVEVSIAGDDVSLIDANGDSANVVTTDIRLTNGVVHLIDGVIMPEQSLNIVETAAAAGNFTTLLGAATATGLDAALESEGPLTVFAPTDAAFTALGVDLAPVSSDVITNILLHHVVAGELASADVVSATSLATLANTALAVDASGSPILVGGSAVGATLDIEASNGLIHVMDEVIVPPTIIDVAVATPDLSTLVTAVTSSSAGVQAALAPDTLAGDSPITVFAPTNAAFAATGIELGTLPQSTLDSVLSHHVVGAQAVSSDLTDGQVVTTLNGDITVNVDVNGEISVTDGAGNTANVVATLVDIRTLDGVVHVIDAVLFPAP